MDVINNEVLKLQILARVPGPQREFIYMCV